MSTVALTYEELREKARQFKRIPVPLRGQCYRNAVATVLRQPVSRIPQRHDDEDANEWLAGVAVLLDFRFEFVSGFD
jgi:hypothetical protein